MSYKIHYKVEYGSFTFDKEHESEYKAGAEAQRLRKEGYIPISAEITIIPVVVEVPMWRKLLSKKNSHILYLIERYSNINGAHHKQWLIDQIVRVITKNNYKTWVEEYNSDPDYNNWDEGIAP